MIVNSISFCGMAQSAPKRTIKGAKDAINQWDVLKEAKYTDVFQESEEPDYYDVAENKRIRNENYKFLDELTDKYDKWRFVQHFKKVTGFPDLEKSSLKMVDEFNRAMNHACYANNTKLLLDGYDPFCSVGFKKALSGSDIDKGFAVVESSDYSPKTIKAQKKFSDYVKGTIWDNMDNRIVSVNHPAAFPNIITDTEIDLGLEKYDEAAKKFYIDGRDSQYYKYLRTNSKNAIGGSKFNINLARTYSDKDEKEDAKNFAYILETIRDGKIHYRNNTPYIENLPSKIENSVFGKYSNVSQNNGKRMEIESKHILKPKLKAREAVQKEFDRWDVEKQYDLVKDIIRHMSDDDNDARFRDLFYSKEDKYRLLINDILRGNVECQFNMMESGREKAELDFMRSKYAQKYADVPLDNTDE